MVLSVFTLHNNKKSLRHFSWVVAVGSKGRMWSVTASVWSFEVAMGHNTGTVWSVTVSAWAAHAVCGLFQPLCGLPGVLWGML